MRSTTLQAHALLALAHSVQGLETRADCTDVHVFLARGNNEPYPGRQGKLVEAICGQIGEDNLTCDYEDIQYYNPLPAPYCDSVTEGQANGVKQITAYSERCPDSRLVVSGFSQGGHVVGDVLGGGGGVFFQDCVQQKSKGLDADKVPGSRIAAALIFGDTRHTANQPFNVLSGSGSNGLFPRTEEQTTNMAKYGDRLRDYCAGDDPICAGGDVVADHLNYFDVYSNDAAAWVKERVEAAGDGSDETTTSSSASKTTTTATTTERSSTTTEADDTTTTEAESSTETTTEEATTSNEETSSTTSSTTPTTSSASTSSEETTTSSAADETTSSSAADETTTSGDVTTSTGADSSAETTTGAGGDGEGVAGVLRLDATLMLTLALGAAMYLEI